MTDSARPASRPLYTAAQIRALDRCAIETHGISGYELMCRAGRALFEQLRARWPDARRVLVLCGAGQNAGDGYVVARLLREAEFAVRVVRLTDPAALKGDARTAADAWRDAGGEAEPFAGRLPVEAELLVDALLGTGLNRPLEGDWRVAVEAINGAGLPVLAVDVPSGLDADRGVVMGAAVEADCTLTFIGRKRGLYTAAGLQHSGAVVFDDLDVPAGIYTAVPAETVLMAAAPLGCLARPRRRDAHKGDCGHVLVIGGDSGMGGAVRLAAEAAARSGAGLVSVATRAAHAATISAARPELMCHGVETAAALGPLIARADVAVVGPGLGRGRWAQALLARLLDTRLPLVVDADALNLLAREPQPRGDWVITPHPGEAARLLGYDSRGVQADRFAAVRELARRYGAVAVLKGAGTLVADPAADTPIAVCARGNPGMASGGMGDALGGVIGALIAQGLAPLAAAGAGVWVHAGAADRAAAGLGERGLLAGDLMEQLPRELNDVH